MRANVKTSEVATALPADFWETHRGELLVGGKGQLLFTEAGRKKYAPLFAKHGYALSSINTVEIFQQVLDRLATEELEATTQKLVNLMGNPAATEEERETIRRVLEASEDRPKKPPTPKKR